MRISRTHRFRHTRATDLINAGVPIHVVMRYFGHLTPTMTMHYANARELHQMGEKSQVGRSSKGHGGLRKTWTVAS